MSKFKVIKGGGGADAPDESRRPSASSLDEGGVEGENEEAALRRALAAYDDSPFLPEPRQAGGTSTVALDFYMRIVRELPTVCAQADLRDSAEFHRLLWLVTRIGGDQKFIGLDQAVAPAAVSRWVCAGQTPGREKRRGILASALVSLDRAVQQRSVVPLITLVGKRAAKQTDDPAHIHSH